MILTGITLRQYSTCSTSQASSQLKLSLDDFWLVPLPGCDLSTSFLKLKNEKLTKTHRLVRTLVCQFSPHKMQSLKSQQLKPEESASHHINGMFEIIVWDVVFKGVLNNCNVREIMLFVWLRSLCECGSSVSLSRR